MIVATATRSILIRQDRVNGVKKDITTKRGEKVQLTEEEAVKFWGALDLKESDKKSLLRFAKANGIKRKI